MTEFVAGVAALVVSVGAAAAGVRAYRINLARQLPPRIPVSALPQDTSLAFVPLARLAARERELADHMAALPDAVAADTWVRAAVAARALRAHALRITAAEPTVGATEDPGGGLDLLAARLREGVSAYERLTDTAADLATHELYRSAPKNAAVRLADATAALVGMIRGLAS